MPATSRILVVDDEAIVREVIATYLEKEGYRVSTSADGAEARRLLQATRPHLVILDVMLPGRSGLDLLADLRREGDTPVILLTARVEEGDRVAGLDLGADDYVTKPFSPRELVARVKSVLRRSQPRPAGSRMEFGPLVIDPGARDVLLNGQSVELTAREFDVLAFLAASPRQVFTRNHLLEQVWDSSAEWQDPATVTVHVRRIRQKIEADAQNPRWIVTVWGVGYRFEP
ncbi:MAG TPA: response regulator transcription factor [Acidimicrobiia bacterium]|nr:response regulator transcription factor [Acidimicrobiia bacterium]